MNLNDADAAFTRIVGKWCGFNVKRFKFDHHKTVWIAKDNRIYCQHCHKHVSPQEILDEHEAFSGTNSETDSPKG